MTKPDFPPAFLAAFLHARSEFAAAVPLGSIPQGIAFGDYQLFRIAEALEAIADAQVTQAVEATEPDANDMWKYESDDDEE
jgi:hypothetical protein